MMNEWIISRLFIGEVMFNIGHQKKDWNMQTWKINYKDLASFLRLLTRFNLL